MIHRPNVALVVLDTARASETPPIREDTMPILAGMAADGSVYRHAFASAPWSLPSHASIFTGTYPSQHGAHGGHTFLDNSHRTLAESFADSGYETIGVSNNTWITEEFGFSRGFETFWKGWQFWQTNADMGTVARADERREKLRRTFANVFDGNPLLNAINIAYSELVQPTGDDGAARTTTRITSWLNDRDSDRPFFLFANYLEPHIDYRPPENVAVDFLPDDVSFQEAISIRQDPRAYDVGEYDLSNREFRTLRGLYRGELAYMDRHLDRLRSALQVAGEWEDTIFVVLGDHGENIGDHGFLGHQYNLYDSLLHVPLIVHGRDFSDFKQPHDDLVQLTDVAPTLLDAADIDDPSFRDQCQGPSFHPTAAQTRDAVFAEYMAPQPSINQLKERFESIPDSLYRFDRSLQAIRTHDEKLITGSDGYTAFYDIQADPHEQHDVSNHRVERAAMLRNRLASWQDSFETTTGREEVTVSGSTKQHLQNLGYM